MNKHKSLCAVCGGESYQLHTVIWPQLEEEWCLSDYEAAYINKQQGHCCTCCHSNMRFRVLAQALLSAYASEQNLASFLCSSVIAGKRILEINKVGTLHAYLKKHPLHRLVEYPEYDMMNLELSSGSYDIVIHSDTLEHVPDPLRGLKECYRVLKNGGKCLYTTPVIVDRPSRSRVGLPDSYHGSPECKCDDFKVHTEFGYDCWRMGLIVGFSSINIHALDYPSALAFELSKT